MGARKRLVAEARKEAKKTVDSKDDINVINISLNAPRGLLSDCCSLLI